MKMVQIGDTLLRVEDIAVVSITKNYAGDEFTVNVMLRDVGGTGGQYSGALVAHTAEVTFDSEPEAVLVRDKILNAIDAEIVLKV